MKTKVLMLAVFMGLATVLVAQPDENGKGKSRRGSNPEMRMNEQRSHKNALNLTDAQKEAFKQSMLAMQKQLQPIRNELGEARARQKTLTSVEKPDMNAVNKNIEKMGSLQTEMAKIRTKYHLEMRAQLTEEQLLKFDRFEHRKRNGNRPEGMKQRGDYSRR